MSCAICTITGVPDHTLDSYASTADEINNQGAAGLIPSGHMPVDNISTPDGVTAALKAKTEQAGVSSSSIISIGGNNKFYGTPLSGPENPSCNIRKQS